MIVDSFTNRCDLCGDHYSIDSGLAFYTAKVEMHPVPDRERRVDLCEDCLCKEDVWSTGFHTAQVGKSDDPADASLTRMGDLVSRLLPETHGPAGT